MPEADAVRPDVLRPTVDASQFGVVQRPLSIGERIYNIGAVRKLAILVLLAAAWEIYARWLHNDLLFPAFSATLQAFVQAMVSGPEAVVKVRSLPRPMPMLLLATSRKSLARSTIAGSNGLTQRGSTTVAPTPSSARREIFRTRPT